LRSSSSLACRRLRLLVVLAKGTARRTEIDGSTWSAVVSDTALRPHCVMLMSMTHRQNVSGVSSAGSPRGRSAVLFRNRFSLSSTLYTIATVTGHLAYERLRLLDSLPTPWTVAYWISRSLCTYAVIQCTTRIA